MEKGGKKIIVREKIFVDGFGIGRRLEEEEVNVKKNKLE